MATKVFVPIVKVENVRSHPNAERLELVDALGYQVVVPKGKYKGGEVQIYFPPDTLLPAKWADLWNVRKYLKGSEQDRIGSIRLRGEISHGLIMPLPESNSWNEFLEAIKAAKIESGETISSDWPVGEDSSLFFPCEKYEPPIRGVCGDADVPDENFPKYTDIQNLRHYPHLFSDGEIISATEKIHGQNSRCGIINDIEKSGSMELPRKRPCRYHLKKDNMDPVIFNHIGVELFGQLPGVLDFRTRFTIEQREKLKELGVNRDQLYDCEICGIDDEMISLHDFWYPWSISEVKKLLKEEYVNRNATQIIIFGEIYGQNIQGKYTYGVTGNKKGYRAFDLMINRKYLDVDDFRTTCARYNVETVPEIYRGPYDFEIIRGISEGNSVIGGSHIREGTVVRPLAERTDPKVGRLVLKYVSDRFIEEKDGSDFKDV